MKFDILVFLFENLSRKFHFDENMTIIAVTLYEDRCIFLIASCSAFLRMRNVSGKSCTENQNTHFVFGNFFIVTLPLMR